MLLNEHQSKTLFKEAGVRVPEGTIVLPGEQATQKPDFGFPWFCKSQVLTGGRGKAGGILKADTHEEYVTACDKLFAMRIKGEAVKLVRVEPGMAFSDEFYLSFAVARTRESIVLTAGRGGMEVESFAEGDARAPLIQNISQQRGLQDHQVRTAFFHLFAGKTPDKKCWQGFYELVRTLYGAVQDYGLLLAEINPLVYTDEGAWVALDGKVEIDDNVRDIKMDLERFYQPEHATREENVAREAGLSYLELDGWVGLLVNGAGLAMATMDLLNFSGLPAANFMDLGGAADEKRMGTALGLLFSNDNVKAVFLNLFGGIVSCESVARALELALDGKKPVKPMVLRFAGFGSEEGKAIVKKLGHEEIFVASEMSEALDKLRSLRVDERTETRLESRLGTPIPKKNTTESARLIESVKTLNLKGDTKVLVQGITGKAAGLHAKLMQEYGTNVVAGVTPFKGGAQVNGVPVYNSVHQAMVNHPDITCSIIFVPAAFAAEAILEAVENNVPNVVCITEGIPQAAMLRVREALRNSSSHLIGPNTPGVIIPGQAKIGIMPAYAFSPGPVALFSRSGTLTYETASRLSGAGIGQSLCVGMGGDPFVGVNFIELLETVRDDDATQAVVVMGEIGGNAEENLAAHVEATGFDKPLFAFIAGQTAPPGKRLGHAGAILEEGGGGIEGKLDRLHQAGFTLCPSIQRIPELVKAGLKHA